MFGKKKTVTFGVEGMMCAHCKAHVEKALLAVKGVEKADANLAEKSVVVVCAPAISEEELKKAVREAGYQAV